jgi:hypothetical protein
MFPKRWFRNIIDTLKLIASAEFQEKGWVKGEVHDYCCFSETICGLYNDMCFEDFIDHDAKEFGLTTHQIEKLDQFRKALNAYLDKHGSYEDHEVIVRDPEWHKIRQLAKECLEALLVRKYLDPSKEIPKESLLSLISDFAFPKFQKRVWIEERRPGKNPFREMMERFFHSNACKTKEIIEQYKDYEVTEEQQRYLIKLYDTLKLYWEKNKDEEDLRKILDEPEWHQIQALSGEILKIFQWKDPCDD